MKARVPILSQELARVFVNKPEHPIQPFQHKQSLGQNYSSLTNGQSAFWGYGDREGETV
jgi:hypothetical protein